MTESFPVVPKPGTPTNPRATMVFQAEFTRYMMNAGTGPVVISQILEWPSEALAQGGVWAPSLVVTTGRGVVNLNFRFPDINAMLPGETAVVFNAEEATATVWIGESLLRFAPRVQVHQATFQFEPGRPALVDHSVSIEIDLAAGPATVWTLGLSARGPYVSATDQSLISSSMGALRIECELPLTTQAAGAA